MKLLIDANLSPRLVEPLVAEGYGVRHVSDIGLQRASDATIFERAAQDSYVVVTADSDFPMMLAARRASSPSVVLLRHVTVLSRDEHVALLIPNLRVVADDLRGGAVVSLSPTRLAVRRLPIA